MGIEATPVLTLDCLAPSPKHIRTRNKGQKGVRLRFDFALEFCCAGSMLVYAWGLCQERLGWSEGTGLRFATGFRKVPLTIPHIKVPQKGSEGSDKSFHTKKVPDSSR